MMDRGLVWTAIRKKLPDLKDDLLANSYLYGSAAFDYIASQLADAVIIKLAGEEEKPVVAEESVYLKRVKESDVPYA